METGTCKLCLTSGAELCDSHFIPRSFYSLFRDGKNEPIRFSSESMYPTSKQIKDLVFCVDCEERFNRDGENWVRPLLPTVGGPFPVCSTDHSVCPSGVLILDPQPQAQRCTAIPNSFET